jgi:hypothetical protein
LCEIGSGSSAEKVYEKKKGRVVGRLGSKRDISSARTAPLFSTLAVNPRACTKSQAK